MKNYGNTVKASIEDRRTFYFATLWKIETTGGGFVRVTDHDRDIEYDGFTYSAGEGFTPSAVGREDGRESNLEITGILESSFITHADLAAHKYDDAKVTEMLVDWRAPWFGPIILNVYYLAELKYTGDVWEAAVEGLGRLLIQPVGKVVTRPCRWNLGDSNCGVNLATYTRSTEVYDIDSPYNARSHFLLDQATPNFIAGDLNFGKLTFTTGANAGITRTVRRQIITAAKVEVWTTLPFPYDIAENDSVTCIDGCDKLLATCRDDYSNLANNGGFPFVPATDRIMVTPKPK